MLLLLACFFWFRIYKTVSESIPLWTKQHNSIQSSSIENKMQPETMKESRTKTPPKPITQDGSVCAFLSPISIFFSPSVGLQDGPSDTTTVDDGPSEETLIETLIKPIEPANNADFLTCFERLLDRFGIEAVLFLKVHRASRWFKISGKRCSMRSKMGFTGLEFRIRSTAEMKKLRFDWDALNGAEASELSPHFIIPSKFKVSHGESINNCFMKVSTVAKGDFLIALKSTGMRDACLRGLELVLLNRTCSPPNAGSGDTSATLPASSSSSLHPNREIFTGAAAVTAADDGGEESDYDDVADDNSLVERSPNIRPPNRDKDTQFKSVYIKP